MQSVLNEGSFLDAISTIAANTVETAQKTREKNKSTYMYGSISKYTQKLVMSFPTICDNTIPLETAQMISKAHEKNLVSMFEMLFSSMSLSGDNGIEILKALHHNLNDNSSIDDIIDAIEKAVGESAVKLSPAELRDIISEMCYELKYKQKVLPVDSFAERSLNEYIVRESYSGTYVTEANSSDEKKYTKKDIDDAYERGVNNEKNSRAGKKDTREDNEEKRKEAREKREQDVYNAWEKPEYDTEDGEKISAKEKRRRTERKEDIDRKKEERTIDYKRRQKERSSDARRRHHEREEDEAVRKSEREFKLAQSRVKDIDYKKANELQPSLLTVSYTSLGPDGKPTGVYKSFVAGVKSRLVGSDAMEIVERLSATATNKITFKDIIRATTGEISLVKDLIAATKQAKINARNAAKRGETAKMWNLLSARAKKNAATGAMRSNEAASITTLVINQETANFLANQYKVDIDSPKVASDIMQKFNLLALVIADEANEVAKFLYDGNTSFEMIAYSSLSKDMKDSKSVNKAINLINKTGR